MIITNCCKDDQEPVCEECDGRCFITAGGHNLECYHCHLLERIAELEQSASVIRTKLIMEKIERLAGRVRALDAFYEDLHRRVTELEQPAGPLIDLRTGKPLTGKTYGEFPQK